MFALSESCAALMYAKRPAACAGAHLHLSFRRASSSGSFVSGTIPCVYLHKSDPYGRSDAPHGPDWLGTANAMVLGQAALNLATHAASDRVALWPQWRSADEEADSLTGGGASARQQNGWGLFISAGQFGVAARMQAYLNQGRNSFMLQRSQSVSSSREPGMVYWGVGA